jgi:hypothetical protein
MMSGLLLGKTLYKMDQIQLTNAKEREKLNNKRKDLDGSLAYDQLFLHDLVHGCVETKLCITKRCIKFNEAKKEFEAELIADKETDNTTSNTKLE